jgi:hypothetical protein
VMTSVFTGDPDHVESAHFSATYPAASCGVLDSSRHFRLSVFPTIR